MMYLWTLFFFFNDTATTEIYTLSLHDALPISRVGRAAQRPAGASRSKSTSPAPWPNIFAADSSWKRERSEEHTSELQSRQYLVCRLLLEKKKNNMKLYAPTTLVHSSRCYPIPH